MDLVGISINHKSSPIELREALNLSASEITEFVPVLKKELLSSGFVLSTCNRTEIFGFPINSEITHNHIKDLLISYKQVSGLKDEHFFNFFSFDAVEHILRVATGLDSMMLGDSQILAQSKTAFKLAEELEFSGPVLQRIFNTAIVTGKRAISETKIGEGATTISYAAVQLVDKIFSDFTTKKVLVIGAGETAELVINYLIEKQSNNITITNRTFSKAEDLSKKYNLKTLEFEQFKEHLFEFDIILSATSSDLPLVTYQDVLSAMKRRRGSPVCITDIAIPRDFEPKVADIENVFYHDIDSLDSIVQANLNKRKNEIPKVEKIIDEEMTEFRNWYNGLQIVPTIKSLHGYFEEIRQDEMRKIKNKINDGEYNKVDDMTRRLLSRLLGPPTSKLREISEKSSQAEKVFSYSMLLIELFHLKK